MFLGLRLQHPEVGLGDLQGELLFGIGQQGRTGLDTGTGLFQRRPCLPVKDRLGDADAIIVGQVSAINGLRPKAGNARGIESYPGADSGVGHQGGACQGLVLHLCGEFGTRLCQCGIGVEGLLVSGDEVFSPGGRGTQDHRRDEQRKTWGETSYAHGTTLL